LRAGSPRTIRPKLEFGQEVELTMVPFTIDDEGNEIVTFAFQPV
jgi:hypothetical protein